MGEAASGSRLEFSFPHSGNKAERGVEFRNSTGLQSLEENVLMLTIVPILTLGSQVPSAYPDMCEIHREVKTKKVMY